MNRNTIISFIYSMTGAIIFLYALGPFLLRLFFSFFGLYLIAVGMRYRGVPPSVWIMRRWTWRP